ncbi:hypothetical protein [Vagococcus fessus]|uniref:Uncharacterized protein n=1 Tax=Vagococcus fessus TaxID=120370 RepID=A0A430ACG5_9ENTE|nr:hypothetical protein [Vagococcus fessus]RSU04904.1 hypothetical protein CBF31_02465 [Vagococcus fessus]
MDESITFKMDRFKSFWVLVLGLAFFILGAVLTLKSYSLSVGDKVECCVLISVGVTLVGASLFVIVLGLIGVIKSPSIITFDQSEVIYYYSFLHATHKKLILSWSDIEDIRLKSLSYLKKTELDEIPTESDFITVIVKKGVLDKKIAGRKMLVVNNKLSISTGLLSDFSSKRLGEALKTYQTLDF